MRAHFEIWSFCNFSSAQRFIRFLCAPPSQTYIYAARIQFGSLCARARKICNALMKEVRLPTSETSVNAIFCVRFFLYSLLAPQDAFCHTGNVSLRSHTLATSKACFLSAECRKQTYLCVLQIKSRCTERDHHISALTRSASLDVGLESLLELCSFGYWKHKTLFPTKPIGTIFNAVLSTVFFCHVTEVIK